MPSITKVYVMIQRFIKQGRAGELNGMLTWSIPSSVTETSNEAWTYPTDSAPLPPATRFNCS